MSRSLNRNHAYLQQFVAQGKPAYIRENDRIALEAMLRCDLSFLCPPQKPLPVPEQDAAVPPDDLGSLADEAEKLALLECWDTIRRPEDRFRRQLRAMQLSDEAINRRPRPSMPRMPWGGSDAILKD